MIRKRRFSVGSALLLAVLGVASMPHISSAKLGPADEEFQFLSALVTASFPDLAEKRLREVEAAFPSEKERIQLARANILIARRKFAEAEDIANQMPAKSAKADAIRLSLGNALYTIGEIDRADKLYSDFFTKYGNNLPTDEDLLRFYQESAYRLVQMRESAGDFVGASKAYELLLKTNPPDDVVRRVRVELGEIYLKVAEKASGAEREQFLKKAEEISSEVRWGGYDIWFGRSISVTAMAEVMRNNKKEAQELLKNYMPDLRQIDKALKDSGINRSLSPLAGARYLLGKLYQEDYEAAKQAGDVDAAKKALGAAITEYLNVFAKYPDSDWGPDAGVRATALKNEAKDLGNIKQDGGQGLQTGAVQISDRTYQPALNLYRQKEYKLAAEEYLRLVNQYPDADATVRAMGNLMISYAEIGNDLYTKVIAEYLSERHADSDFAAMNLLRIAKHYYDKNLPEEYFWYYDRYVESFKNHDKVAQILYTLSALSGKIGDVDREQAYLQRLIDEHPQSKFSNQAMSKKAFDLYKREKYAEAIAPLKAYIDAEQPGLVKAQARLALADSYKETENFTAALKEYTSLVKDLSPETQNPYRGGLEDEKVADILRTASFFVGYGLQKLDVPDANLAAVRGKAVKAYENFLNKFGDQAVELAPKAMRQIGTLQLELGQTDQAAKTFNAIADQYPDSQEGRDAFFLLVDSLIELEQYEDARLAFARMMKNKARYSPAQYARIGQLMLEREFYDEALQAFELVGDASGDAGIEQRTLFGKGQSYYESQQYQKSVDALEALLSKYETTALYYDTKFLLASAYRKLQKFDESGEHLTDVFKFAQEAALRNKASLELARLQKASGEDNEALASYLRVALLGTADDAESRQYIQTSILEGIELAQELEDWENASEMLDIFLSDYPNHEKIPELRRLRNQINLRLQTVQN